jgi:hypothetical protein
MSIAASGRACGVPLISRAVLAARLRELEEAVTVPSQTTFAIGEEGASNLRRGRNRVRETTRRVR